MTNNEGEDVRTKPKVGVEYNADDDHRRRTGMAWVATCDVGGMPGAYDAQGATIEAALGALASTLGEALERFIERAA